MWATHCVRSHSLITRCDQFNWRGIDHIGSLITKSSQTSERQHDKMISNKQGIDLRDIHYNFETSKWWHYHQSDTQSVSFSHFLSLHSLIVALVSWLHCVIVCLTPVLWSYHIFQLNSNASLISPSMSTCEWWKDCFLCWCVLMSRWTSKWNWCKFEQLKQTSKSNIVI